MAGSKKRPGDKATGSAKKRSKSVMTIEEKVKLCDRLDNGESAASVGRSLGINESTVRYIRKNAAKIRSAYANPLFTKGTKSLKTAAHEKMEAALLLWVQKQRKRLVPLSGAVIREQAQILQEKIVEEEGEGSASKPFHASSGWLHNFIKRHGLKNICMTGEAADADLPGAEAAKEELRRVIEEGGYTPDQVFNADETGLYWKRMPTRTYIMKDEARAPGYKAAKDRFTLLLCANASGNYRMKPLMIYHSENPRALKNQVKSALPVKWKSNKKGWMTGEVFEQWWTESVIPDIKEYCRKENLSEKALIIVDNASSHPHHVNLLHEGIQIYFLPPNTTSIIQPMDQGVIAQVKVNYMKRCLRQMLHATTADENITVKEFWKNYTIKDALMNVSQVWNAIEKNL